MLDSLSRVDPCTKPSRLNGRIVVDHLLLESEPNDRQLLQIILSGVVGKRRLKPLALSLIQHFGSFARVVCAGEDELAMAPGICDASFKALKAAHTGYRRIAKQPILGKPILTNVPALLTYLRFVVAYEPVEHLRVLYLDSTHHLICDVRMSSGSVNFTPLFPRAVLSRALALNASGLVLVHNHPSGNPAPSMEDIEATAYMKKAALLLDIVVVDHLIVGQFGWVSFKQSNLL